METNSNKNKKPDWNFDNDLENEIGLLHGHKNLTQIILKLHARCKYLGFIFPRRVWNDNGIPMQVIFFGLLRFDIEYIHFNISLKGENGLKHSVHKSGKIARTTGSGHEYQNIQLIAHFNHEMHALTLLSNYFND